MRSVQQHLHTKESIPAQLGPIAVAITITVLLLTLLAALIGTPAHAAAQGAFSIEAMAIDLKPEYESRDMVVAYSVQVANKGKTEGSLQLTLPVPPGSRLKGVYEMTDTGTPEIPGASISGSKDAAAVSFSTPVIKPGKYTTVYALYNWDGIQFKGKSRSVEFVFQPPFSVSSAVLKVTEPEGSTDMVTTPATAFRMGDATPISIIPIASLQAGKTLTVKLEYNRVGGSSGTRSNTAIIALAALMVAALGFLLWRGTRSSKTV